MKSVAIAIIFIMAYIAFRFDLRFAPGGIVALVHDVGIALGAMVIARKEITLSTVAAMLTIVGYSINDTVIVYDRIRENLGKHRGMSFAKIINLSVSEMLGRTIITSGVTALSIVCFLWWGTGVIRDFSFAPARRHHRRHVLVDLRGRAAHRVDRSPLLRRERGRSAQGHAHAWNEARRRRRLKSSIFQVNPPSIGHSPSFREVDAARSVG